MAEVWQLFDQHGEALSGEGASPDDVFSQGLLHGASHVWIWRRGSTGPEVMLQKRSAEKRTWPNRYDISAAGHIDLGETPLLAAIRESKEEIGLDVSADEVRLMGVHRAYEIAESGDIENEYQWLYLVEMESETTFSLQQSEVGSVQWVSLKEIEKAAGSDDYVPHGSLYYGIVVREISRTAQG
jgi:8-oxo-dGTP pyrophosphatase MutT (NUDIX family)